MNEHHPRTATASSNVDIAVGGAGLAGKLMALALARSLGDEISIGIIDPALKAPHSRRSEITAENTQPADPRCSSLSASSRTLLEAIGIWGDIADDAQPVTRIEIADSDLNDAVRMPRLVYDNHVEDPVDGDETPGSYIVANASLAAAADQALANCASVTTLAGKISSVRSNNGTAALATDIGEIRAQIVIAADGGRSAIRRICGIKTLTSRHRQSAIVVIMGHTLPHEGIAVQNFLPNGPFAILPLPGEKSCVTWSEDAREAERILALDDEGFARELGRRFGGQLGELSVLSRRVAFPLQTQVARELTHERVALIGDAARTVHPIAGQGLNLAIRDIAALAECVVDAMRLGLDAGDPSVLERYARWRRFDSITSATTFAMLNRMFSNNSTLARSARDFGMGLLDRMPSVKRRLVNEAAGVTGELPKLLRGEII